MSSEELALEALVRRLGTLEARNHTLRRTAVAALVLSLVGLSLGGAALLTRSMPSPKRSVEADELVLRGPGGVVAKLAADNDSGTIAAQ
jgi:hypothetical protein